MRIRHLISILISIILVALIYTGEIKLPAKTSSTPQTSGVLSQSALDTLAASSTAMYDVVRVVDGDTIIVRIEDNDVTVRLIGMDTPEVVDPRKPVECFGKQASDKAKATLSSMQVHLATDSSQDTYDKYGRLLAYVYLEDGTLFNKMMIADGYAHEYTYDIPYRFQTDFKLAEKDARMHERGLWAADTCNGDTGTNSSPVSQN